MMKDAFVKRHTTNISSGNKKLPSAASYIMLKSVVLLKICIVSVLSSVVNFQMVAAVNVGDVVNRTSIRQINGDGFGRRSPISIPRCTINGFTYQHGQIIRSGGDPCITCLCVYGNMYCRWAHTRGQLAHCHSHAHAKSHPTTSTDDSGDQLYDSQLTTLREIVNDNDSLNEPTSYQLGEEDLFSLTSTDNINRPEIIDKEDRTRQSAGVSGGSTVTDSNASSLSPTSLSTVCIVMGREYYQGEVLPHETGTCLECRCGREGRVTCSPKDCIAQQEDEFHNPGNSNSLDMFDVDIF